MRETRQFKVLLLVSLLTAAALPLQALASEEAEPVYDPSEDLVAFRTATAPTIDGNAEAIWDDAIELATLVSGNSGNFQVKMKAMFDDDNIYILTYWDEFIPSKVDKDRDAWELTSNSTPGTWDHKDWGTDRLSFFWMDPDNPVTNFTTNGCDGICHDLEEMHTLVPGETLDAWEWSASTTNEQGYADDGVLKHEGSVTIDPKRMHVLDSDLDWDKGNDGWWVNNDTQSANPRPSHVWKQGATPADPSYMYDTDAEEVDWGTFDIASITQGAMVPGHILMNPTGDRADVQAKGVHSGNTWTVEFKRARDTSSDDDTPFLRTNVPYYFSPSVTINTTGEDHSKGIQVYKMWLAEPEEPDLVVQRINPVGSGFIVNDTADVGVFVENIGWGDAPASKLKYSWNGTAAEWEADVEAIPWGQTKYLVLSVPTDGLEPGNNTLDVWVDSQDTIAEIIEVNNRGNITLELGAEPLPDLEITAVALDPPDVTQGAVIEVTVTVLNNGTNASVAPRLLVWVDDPADPLFNDTGNAIAIDGTRQFVFDWGPVDLPAGDYVLNATVDPMGAIKELDETDNTRLVDVTVEEPTFPDLVIEELKPIAGQVKQDAETHAQVVVKNVGGATAEGGFEVALFLDQAFTSGTTGLMATCSTAEDLLVGENVTMVLTWTVPQDAEVGPHFVRAEADWTHSVEELDESNNNKTYEDLIVLKRDLPDLLILEIDAESEAKVGTIFEATVTIKNNGTLVSQNTSVVMVENTTRAVASVPGLAVGEEVDLTLTWDLSMLQVGEMTLEFHVDPEDFIAEDNEFNNAKSFTLTLLPADKPDLEVTVEGITFTPAEPQVGEGVTISIEVENLGTMASPNTTVEAWVGNTRIDERTLLAVASGESRTVDVIWAASSITSAQSYNIRVVVDPNSEVSELNESNNEVFASITFVLPPQAKLGNLTLELSGAEVKEGKEVTATVTLNNTGDEAASLTIELKDGLTVIDSKGPVVVPAGGQATETFTFKLEGKGEHTITVRVLDGAEVAKDADGNDLINDVVINVKEDGDDGPGFGALAALLAVALVVAVASPRRRKA